MPSQPPPHPHRPLRALALAAASAPAWAQSGEAAFGGSLAGALLAGSCLLVVALVLLRRQGAHVRESGRLGTAMLDHSPQLIVLLDDASRVLRGNATAERWLDQRLPALLGGVLWEHGAWAHDPAQGLRLRRAVADAAQGKTINLDSTMRLAGESLRHLEITLRPVGRAQGGACDVLLEARDVSIRKQIEDKLHLAAIVLDNAKEGVLITDSDWRVLSANTAFQRISGCTEQDIAARSLRSLGHMLRESPLRRRVLQALRQHATWEGELDVRRADGQPCTLWVSLTLCNGHSDHGGHVLLLASDITDWKQAQNQLVRHARFDALTDLPNRENFLERLQGALASPTPQPLAVLRLNVDQLGDLSHHFSYEIGDRALIEVGQRLRAVLGEADTVARLGGAEFAVLLPGAQADAAARMAARLMEAVAQPWHFGPNEFSLTISVGIALGPAHGQSSESLMRAANAAIHRARQDGQGVCHVYDAGTEQRSLRHLQLEAALRKAIPRGELMLHYQPQLMASSGRAVGLEALVRWRHPELGMISPGEFIPLAEASGQIAALGDWVMREAARQMAEWIGAGLPPLVVAVNLSALQFRDPHLLDKVRAVLAETGLPPQCLELELTESVAAQNPAAAIAMMDALHALGVRLAIDDFGTGYSSLSHLKRFRIHTLKIDQSFVRDISTDADDRAIVRTIIDMARALNLTTIAEGVETEAQADFLRDGGCTMVQGYHFCRPQDAATITDWLAQHAPLTASAAAETDTEVA